MVNKEKEDLNKKCNTYVYFGFDGEDFDPTEISERLNLNPTEIWKRGDKNKFGRIREYSHWKLSTEEGKEYLDIPKLINEIVCKFEKQIEQIKELKRRLGLTSRLQIVLDIDKNEEQSTPILNIEKKVIDFLYKTETDIDIDIYRFESE